MGAGLGRINRKRIHSWFPKGRIRADRVTLSRSGQQIAVIGETSRYGGRGWHADEGRASPRLGDAAPIETIRERHSYDVPEVLAFKVEDGARSYLEWVVAETGPR